MARAQAREAEDKAKDVEDIGDLFGLGPSAEHPDRFPGRTEDLLSPQLDAAKDSQLMEGQVVYFVIDEVHGSVVFMIRNA